MNQPMSSKVAVIIGTVVFLVVVIAGFLYMTRGPDCLDPEEANLQQLVVVVGSNGECFYRPAR